MDKLECEICGLPMSFVKEWTIAGRGAKIDKDGKKIPQLKIFLYKCKDGHIKRIAKKL